MTADEFVAFRKKLDLTQAALANLFDMSPRALQDIESGRASLRHIHVLALQRVAFTLAAARSEVGYVDDTMLQEARDVVALGEAS
jgi:transcriptional regulator with XRE-family HTH domain